ncbi:putative ATP synthase subunit delta, mitochondrial [Hypsibius exemplaris]|uniref:ATP synthase F(1) complex subunit delta, mitochondrial n=1 Tax=Hypsibius exemplaris TaxID=2072580 RepID=A0A1W0X6I1_HYPEX|nr:putative ATP synthase subunit delta, mitochondrial [Hypsibius exemplaris]
MHSSSRLLVAAVRQLNGVRNISTSRAGLQQMKFTFASPGQVFYADANVKQVDVPSMSGNFGILANHVPMLAVLQAGVLNVFETDAVSKKYFVSGGTVTVNDDSTVQILAEEAVPVENLDRQSAREGLAAAQQKLNSASGEIARAEAQIAVETYEALVKATD